MGEIPEDPAARAARLEHWAVEQLERAPHRESRSASLVERVIGATRGRFRVDRIEHKLDDYVDRLLDRGLSTYRHAAPDITTVDSVVYVPSSWHVLPRALRAVGASGHDVFVDFGCGKGRIVHQAARWPLKRVIGVELSTELAEFAQSLVAAHRNEYRCPDVTIVAGDATSFQVPDDLTIAYLFDPFRGRTLDAVLLNLIGSIDRHPRSVRLIYVHPLGGAQVLATGRFRLVKWQRGGLRDSRRARAAIFESLP